jgi:hypothetical protein
MDFLNWTLGVSTPPQSPKQIEIILHDIYIKFAQFLIILGFHIFMNAVRTNSGVTGSLGSGVTSSSVATNSTIWKGRLSTLLQVEFSTWLTLFLEKKTSSFFMQI